MTSLLTGQERAKLTDTLADWGASGELTADTLTGSGSKNVAVFPQVSKRLELSELLWIWRDLKARVVRAGEDDHAVGFENDRARA